MRLPPQVEQVLAAFDRAGHRAFLVGGALRDLLRGESPQDFDIASSAPPQAVAVLFPHCKVVETGLAYGTVTLLLGGISLEITSFRREEGYQDGRHPTQLAPAATIEEDLARRDFTINAMAYHPQTGLVDPWGGRADLQAKVIRAVGEPASRFGEDGLRILRALRFAATLDFSIEPETTQALLACRPMLEKISQERITKEFTLLVCGQAAPRVLGQFAPIAVDLVPELGPMQGFAQRNAYHIYDVWQHTLHVLEYVPQEPVTKLAALFHDVGKPQSFFEGRSGLGHFKGHAIVSDGMAGAIMARMRFPNQLRQQVCQLVRWHNDTIRPQDGVLRRWLNLLGPQQLQRLVDLQLADNRAKSPKSDTAFAQALHLRIAAILQRGDCYTLGALAVDGRDLAALGLKGPALGATLQWLLEQVMEKPALNTKQQLLELAQNSLARESDTK